MKIKSRYLGYIETFSALMHDNCHGSSNFGSITDFYGKFDKEATIKALKLLQMRHPNLRAKLSLNNNNIYELAYFSEGNISLEILEKNNTGNATAILESNIKTHFNSSDLLWKCILLYDEKHFKHTLITIFHHSIADGMSAWIFSVDFLYFLESFSLQRNIEVDKLPILDSIEANLSHKVSWKEYLEQEKRMSNDIMYKQSLWKYQNIAKLVDRKTTILSKKISKDTVARLKLKTAAKELTFNHLLNAVAFSVLQEKYTGSDLSLNMATPVNLRNKCSKPIDKENIGSYINWMPVPIKSNRNLNLWNLAKNYKESFSYTLEKYGLNPSNCDQNYILNNAVKYFKDEDTIPAVICCVTNLGSLEPHRKLEYFKLNYFNFGLCHITGGAAIIISCVTMNDVLHVNFSFTEPLLKRAWMNEFADIFDERMLKLSRE